MMMMHGHHRRLHRLRLLLWFWFPHSIFCVSDEQYKERVNDEVEGIKAREEDVGFRKGECPKCCFAVANSCSVTVAALK